MGFFWVAHGWGGEKRPPLPKIGHTYSTTIKLETFIPYLKKIQKIYESGDTPLEFCYPISYWKSGNFAISRNTDIDCILMVKTLMISAKTVTPGLRKSKVF